MALFFLPNKLNHLFREETNIPKKKLHFDDILSKHLTYVIAIQRSIHNILGP